jgi:hypothetical protein
MTTQLNPAWRRKPASSDRLAKISERYLSDMPDTTKQNDFCRAIPFLLDNPGQSWITHDLCQVLTQRGHNSVLCHLDEHSTEPAGLAPTLCAQASAYTYCILPFTTAATARSQAFDHVVLLVPAHLDAVRTAYQRIKILSERTPPEIGIVLVGPRDQHAAWRYFRKLAVGTLRYLDVPLLNLGFLPEQVTPEHGPADHHRNNFLTRVSERLISSEFYHAASGSDVQEGA